jgi:sulfur carrier protein
MTTITLNGEHREVDDDLTLAGLVALLTHEPKSIATAVNGEFVPRDARAMTPLRPGDAVFTFQPITGG